MNLTKDKAYEATDALVTAGYRVTLHAGPSPGGHVWLHPETDEPGAWPMYRVTLTDMGYDQVDLNALMKLAEGVELEVRYSQAVLGFHLVYPDKTPEAVREPRRRPLVQSVEPEGAGLVRRRPVRDSPQA